MTPSLKEREGHMLHMCKQMYRMLCTLRLHGGCNSYFFLNMKNQNVCWTNQITTHNKFIWVLGKKQKTMFRLEAALQRWNFNKCSQRHNTTQHQHSRKWNNIDCRSRRACSDNIYLDLVLLSSQHICTKLMRSCFVSMLRKFLRCSVFMQIIKAWA